jgi:hypothetical protein
LVRNKIEREGNNLLKEEKMGGVFKVGLKKYIKPLIYKIRHF